MPTPGTAPGLPENIAQVDAPRFSFSVSEKKQIPLRSPNARRSYLSLALNLFFWTILVSLVFAIFLVFQAPDSIQPEVKKNPAASESLVAFFNKASTSSGGTWMGSEDSINGFLLENVKLVPLTSRIGIHTEFDRCFVELSEGSLYFVMQQSIQGHPLYFSLELVPYSEGGDLKIRFAGASLGRLPVPVALTPFIVGLWKPCFDSLGDVMDKLESASSASVTPKSLVIRWPGKSDS